MITLFLYGLTFVAGVIVGALFARRNASKVEAAVVEANVVADATKKKVDELRKK